MQKLVWVVDDDQGILDVTEIILNDAGYKVITIPSEESLAHHLKSKLPSLILLDISISGLDGREVAQRIKSDIRTKQIPIVIMSADANIETKAKDAGVEKYLKKPFDIIQLETIVKTLIQ
jgi:CheY-like chemotaxis protein